MFCCRAQCFCFVTKVAFIVLSGKEEWQGNRERGREVATKLFYCYFFSAAFCLSLSVVGHKIKETSNEDIQICFPVAH